MLHSYSLLVRCGHPFSRAGCERLFSIRCVRGTQPITPAFFSLGLVQHMPPLRFSSHRANPHVWCGRLLLSAAQVRLGPSRRMLHGNGDRGVWLERHRQTEHRMPLFNRYLPQYVRTCCCYVTRFASPQQGPERLGQRCLLLPPCFVFDIKIALDTSPQLGGSCWSTSARTFRPRTNEDNDNETAPHVSVSSHGQYPLPVAVSAFAVPFFGAKLRLLIPPPPAPLFFLGCVSTCCCRWTHVPGVSSSRPRDQDPPRQARECHPQRAQNQQIVDQER